MNKGKLIIKQNHTNCDIVGTKSEAYILRNPFYANFKGNVTKQENMYHWYPIICNDPPCTFFAIVDWLKLSEFIKIELASQDRK